MESIGKIFKKILFQEETKISPWMTEKVLYVNVSSANVTYFHILIGELFKFTLGNKQWTSAYSTLYAIGQCIKKRSRYSRPSESKVCLQALSTSSG